MARAALMQGLVLLTMQPGVGVPGAQEPPVPSAGGVAVGGGVGVPLGGVTGVAVAVAGDEIPAIVNVIELVVGAGTPGGGPNAARLRR